MSSANDEGDSVSSDYLPLHVHVCRCMRWPLWDVIEDLCVMTGIVGFHHSHSERRCNLSFLHRAITVEPSLAVPPPPPPPPLKTHSHAQKHISQAYTLILIFLNMDKNIFYCFDF